MKVCAKCGKRKRNQEFHLDRRAKSGKSSWCGTCKREYMQVLRAQRPEQELIHLASARAKRKGVPCTLKPGDFEIPTFCPVFGYLLRRNQGSVGPDSPTLDRIRPDLGYVPGNVAVISHYANLIKSNATSADLYKVADWLYEQEKNLK